MNKVIKVYKQIGLTPLQTIDQLRKDKPEYKNATLGYAGRLDPMAEGLLLVLVDDENKKRKEYERLPKEYEFDILFGFSTDTYDLMGIVEEKWEDRSWKPDMPKIKKVAASFVGKFIQPYPPYSSARVNGKPLYYWARGGKINEVKIPEKEVEIYSFEVKEAHSVSGEELLQSIINRINKVDGVFRQEEIIKRWKEVLHHKDSAKYYFLNCKVTCSSGTYIRSIANKVDSILNIPTVALKIKRTKVGNFHIEE